MALFDLSKAGTGSVATSLWLDLGVIPVGYKMQFGICYLGSTIKSISFNIRTNKATKSLGNTTDTTLIAGYSVGTRTKPNPYDLDLYKNGALANYTVVGTGVEKLWLQLVAKGSLAAFNYNLNYMLV